jgi:hypothetical protein
MNSRRKWRIAAVLSAVLLLTTVTARAQDFIAAPESLPGGLSYQQWSAEWWQWVFHIPFSINPIFDTTGADCGVDQSKSGPWFLAGTSGFNATRNCTIPAGRMIFFPIINLGNDYPCLDLSPTPPRQRKDANFQPGPGQSLEQFLTIGYGAIPGARQPIDHVTAVSATLDGVPVTGLSLPPENSKYRATSPLFEFDGDRSLQATFDPCVGPGHKAVSDGYWIMLKPLSPGPHTLVFSGTETFPGGSFTVTVTYNLTIV